MKRMFMAVALGFALLASAGMGIAGENVVRILSIEFPIRETKEFLFRVIDDFEASNPGVKVSIDFMDPPSFKTKLTTMLSSPERPDAFFTWTGGVFHDQADAGVLEDITDKLSAEFKANCAGIGLDSVRYKGRIYGVPMYAESVALWYNKDLLAQANVDPAAIRTWDDFLAATEKLKAAGITPIVVGGKDKWPLHFYYAFLTVRQMGIPGIAAAAEGENGGFLSDDFIRAGREYRRLADLEPFQPGFMDTQNPKAFGLFGDGKGAFMLMFSFLVPAHARNSTSGEGLGDKLDFIPFPSLAGGKGDGADTLGGVNGWLVTKNANPATIKFLEHLVSPKFQSESAGLGFWLPIVKGAETSIVDSRLKRIATLLGQAPHHQLYLDQALGAVVGAAVNDAAAEMATGEITPEEAAERVDEARELR